MGLNIGEGKFVYSKKTLEAFDRARKTPNEFNFSVAKLSAGIDAYSGNQDGIALELVNMSPEDFGKRLLANDIPGMETQPLAEPAPVLAAQAPAEIETKEAGGNIVTRGFAAVGSAVAAAIVGRPAMAAGTDKLAEIPVLPPSTFLTQRFEVGNLDEAQRRAAEYVQRPAAPAQDIAAASDQVPAAHEAVANPELDALIEAVSGKHTVLSKSKWRKDENVILQKALIELGYLKPETGEEIANPEKLADGYFGDRTDKAVRDFQKAHGLKADGKVGNEQTWPALLEKLNEKCSAMTAPATELGQLDSPLPNLAQNSAASTQFIG